MELICGILSKDPVQYCSGLLRDSCIAMMNVGARCFREGFLGLCIQRQKVTIGRWEGGVNNLRFSRG